MSQFAQIAQTLNQLADEKRPVPEDLLKAATERGDSIERIIEELDEDTKRALADAKECADVVAAAQRLMEAMDARAAAFKASLLDVVEERCRAVDAEYDALIVERPADVEALGNEKARKVEELLRLVDSAEHGADWSDHLVALRQIDQLKGWTRKTRSAIVFDSKQDPFTVDGLFERVKGKANIAIIGTTTDGDVFGGSTAGL